MAGSTPAMTFVSMVRHMPDDLWERDILTWSERQAELLRRVAGGERVNDIDWPHVIEEIADVGITELNAIKGLLEQMMVHLVKIHLSPDDLARAHWQIELHAFFSGVSRRFAPSMRQRIDVEAIWSRTRRTMLRYLSADPLVRALPEHCPWSLEELLANDPDALLAALPASQPPEAT
jgi:hypothetical protein